jgi:hypothetical protein
MTLPVELNHQRRQVAGVQLPRAAPQPRWRIRDRPDPTEYASAYRAAGRSQPDEQVSDGLAHQLVPCVAGHGGQRFVDVEDRRVRQTDDDDGVGAPLKDPTGELLHPPGPPNHKSVKQD